MKKFPCFVASLLLALGPLSWAKEPCSKTNLAQRRA